ncbi:uncharacterized protein LOC131934652 [Physella acuta]|uniref:uncharacterized protein LOC131934652 n=1 Tax=Physella acuta TaxID=109671 RepID=UPI0027DB8BA6|nr:uncharacterized protein LOC131934652 [Physella acuta]
MILGLLGIFFLFGDTFAQTNCSANAKMECYDRYIANSQSYGSGHTLLCSHVEEYYRCFNNIDCFTDSQTINMINEWRSQYSFLCRDYTVKTKSVAASLAYSSRTLALLSVVIMSWWFYI